MKTQVVASFVFLGAMASCAFAAELSIKGSVNETVQGGNNYFLLSNPSGTTAQSTTAGTLDFLAQTPTTSYLLNTNFSYYKYFGPGAADTPLVWGTPASATFTINHVTELTKYNFAASWSRFDEATALLAQTGSAAGRGSVNNYNVGGGVSRDLSRTDVISWSGNASTVSYTDQSQTPYLDFTTGLTWTHDVSPTTGLINSVNVDWFSSDNSEKSQRLFWRLMTGFQSRLTSRLTLKADVGVGLVNSWQNGTAPSVVTPIVPPPVVGAFVVPPPFVPQVGTGSAVLADATLTYDLFKDTRLSLNAAHTIVPLLTGQLQQSDTIGMSANYNINNYSNLAASAQLTHTPPAPAQSSFGSGQSGSSDFYSFVLSYGYQLSREWRTNVSYSYLQRDDDTGAVGTSIILVSLTRDFTLMGNPTAINKAETERARQRERNSVGYAFPYFR